MVAGQSLLSLWHVRVGPPQTRLYREAGVDVIHNHCGERDSDLETRLVCAKDNERIDPRRTPGREVQSGERNAAEY
jgi:hypothetical protein